MKLLNKAHHLYLFAFMVILPSLSIAGAWTEPPSAIDSIRTDVGKIRVSGLPDPGNPESCDKSFPLVLDPSREDYPEMYALLVASFLQGKPVKVYVSGCIQMYNYNYPRITAIDSY